MWISIVIAAVVALVLLTLLARRRARSRVPFAQLSREDQVAAMENVRRSSGIVGAHESAKAQGGSFRTTQCWNISP